MKTRFSRWRPWRPSWTSDRINFCYFDLQVTLMLPTKFRSVGLLVKEKKRKTDFQDCRHGFTIETIVAIFDLQVTSMLPTKF